MLFAIYMMITTIETMSTRLSDDKADAVHGATGREGRL